MSNVVIRAENLGKKYRIQHQHERQRYVALRDVFADKLLAPWRWLSMQSAKCKAPPPLALCPLPLALTALCRVAKTFGPLRTSLSRSNRAKWLVSSGETAQASPRCLRF